MRLMPVNTSTMLMLAVLIIASVATVVQVLPPAPLSAAAPAAQFSAERAIGHIQAIAQQPHPTGSAANAAVRQYIVAELKRLGLATETQRDGDLENVLGRIAGSHSTDAVVLTAHLDSTPQSPGAMDDSSGVAVLLETARVLMLEARMRNSIVFLFTDHEEGGLYGAKAFIARHPRAGDARVVIGFDAGGIGGPGILSATSPNNGWLIRQLAAADPYLVGNSAINALASSSTDFGRAFKPAGFAGYAFDLYWDKRDGPEDNLANLSPASIQHQGYHALALARHFGNLDALADPKEPDVIFFSVLRLFVVIYSAAQARLLAAAAACLAITVLAYGLQQRLLSWRGIGYGALVAIAGALVAALPELLLEHVVGRWEPRVTYDYDHRLIDQPVPMSSIGLSAVGLALLWHAVAGRVRPSSLADRMLGALLPVLAGAVATSIALPALSYGFVWPLMAGLTASANWLYWRARGRWSASIGATLLASLVVNVVVVGPAIVLGLFDQLLLALITLGMLCGLLLPQIQLLTARPH